MQRKKVALLAILVLTGIAAGLFWYYSQKESSIRPMIFDKDAARIDALFHKEDNWYWMICNEHLHMYCVDHMLRYKTSSQYEKKHDLIIKVMELDNKIAGFTAYYPKSAHTWQFLFLLVDQDFRRQGVAKKLLTYAVHDMVARGAIKIDLVTRIENQKAQALYKKFGFVQVNQTKQHVMMTWYAH